MTAPESHMGAKLKCFSTHSLPLPINTWQAQKCSECLCCLFSLPHVLSLALGLHFMSCKLKVYILSKLSTALVQWFIKPGIFFPFMVIPDMSEKGRQLLLEMSSLNLGRDLKPKLIYNLNLLRLQCNISKKNYHSRITSWGCGKFW